jgi:hypothetical protein
MISSVWVKTVSDVSETVSVSIIRDSCDEACVYVVHTVKHMRNIIRCDQLQAK